MDRSASPIRRLAKRVMGEGFYRQFRDIKDQIVNKKLARLMANTSPTVFPPALVAALGTSPGTSDIVDHIGTLFFHTLLVQARLVVEVGTRGGESTRALLAAVAMTDGRVLSIDIDDCTGISLPQELKKRWQFIRADDVAFGRNKFEAWCRDAGLAPSVDVLFIDTSHLYDHTVQEIETWHRHVRPGGLMIFHDTNMGEGLYKRIDGSVGLGWDNQRGVIKAIEEFLGTRYDENSAFVDIPKDWAVLHIPYCNGFTIMQRLPESAATAPAG
jgi:predicted O-methyltransferase YrrM